MLSKFYIERTVLFLSARLSFGGGVCAFFVFLMPFDGFFVSYFLLFFCWCFIASTCIIYSMYV